MSYVVLALWLTWLGLETAFPQTVFHVLFQVRVDQKGNIWAILEQSEIDKTRSSKVILQSEAGLPSRPQLGLTLICSTLRIFSPVTDPCWTNSNSRATDVLLKLIQVVATQRKASFLRRKTSAQLLKGDTVAGDIFSATPTQHILICPRAPEFQGG